MNKVIVTIGVAPTRRDAFLKENAHEMRDAIYAALGTMNLEAEFVNIDGINEEGLLLDDISATKTIERFRQREVDGVFFPHANFGTEFAVATVAQALGVPVLIWGPQDDAPSPEGMRSRDTQCGLFAVGKVLRRMNVPFDYISNCRISDPRFRHGLEAFIGVCRTIKMFRGLRILQIAPRPQPFWSVICNEGELLERYGIQVSTITLSEVVRATNQCLEQEPDNYLAILASMTHIDYGSCSVDSPKAMAALASVMQDFCIQRRCSAIAIQCWDAMQDELHIMPCHSNALLSNVGIPVACETDIHGAISAILLQAAANDVPFFADMTIRHPDNRNAELLWHCGNFPTCLVKENTITAVTPNVLLSHGCPGTGAYQLKDGDLTICRFDGDHGNYKLFIGEGKTTDGPKTTGTYVWLEVSDLDKWEYKLVMGPYIHHCSAVYGHVAHILYQATKYIPGLTPELADITEEQMLERLLRP